MDIFLERGQTILPEKILCIPKEARCKAAPGGAGGTRKGASGKGRVLGSGSASRGSHAVGSISHGSHTVSAAEPSAMN